MKIVAPIVTPARAAAAQFASSERPPSSSEVPQATKLARAPFRKLLLVQFLEEEQRQEAKAVPPSGLISSQRVRSNSFDLSV